MKKMLHCMSAACMTVFVALLSGCGNEKSSSTISPPTRGGVSGILSVDSIALSAQDLGKRSAALLGVFVSEYVSVAPAAIAAEGGLKGIEVQMQIAIAQNTVQDPDFDLIQGLADALQVDVQDLLNRSPSRQEALDTYRTALNNVASRSNNRFKELSTSLEQLKDELRDLGKEKSSADRALKTALRNKDFSDAGEKQRAVNESQALYAKRELNKKQLDDLVSTMDTLLTLYGQKILAIDSNREVLISGAKVVDVPGVDELNIIQKKSTSTRRSSRGSNSFDQLFE